jgi:chromosomal replication initiation ATPase DnaA
MTADVDDERIRLFFSRTLRGVIRQIAKVFEVSERELLGESRRVAIAKKRQAAMAICCRISGKSLPRIGHAFRRDHSTIHHGREMMAAHIAAVAAELRPEATAADWAMAMKRRIEPL